jgi:hypothetical protein
MCIYCNTANYRGIYENHYGPIPRDDNGVSYHIHHIDGNRNNNYPENLVALSVTEHYETHLRQGDWAAAARLADVIGILPEERSELTRKHNLKMMDEGRHPWSGNFASERNAKLVKENRHNFLGGKIQSETSTRRVKDGTHNWQKRADGTSFATDRVKNGTHPLTKRVDGTSVATEQLNRGVHPTQKKWTCEFCGVSGVGASNLSQHHKNGKCLTKPNPRKKSLPVSTKDPHNE